MIEEQACIGCGIVQPLTEFYVLKGMANGHRKDCKRCHSQRVAEGREIPVGPFLSSAPVVPLYRLVYEEEDWKGAAACAGEAELDGSYDQFFADDTGNVNQVKVTKYTKCVVCPVAFECLEYSARIEARDGLWGGMMGDTRRRFLNRYDLKSRRARYEHAAVLKQMATLREQQKARVPA